MAHPQDLCGSRSVLPSCCAPPPSPGVRRRLRSGGERMSHTMATAAARCAIRGSQATDSGDRPWSGNRCEGTLRCLTVGRTAFRHGILSRAVCWRSCAVRSDRCCSRRSCCASAAIKSETSGRATAQRSALAAATGSFPSASQNNRRAAARACPAAARCHLDEQRCGTAPVPAAR